MSVKIAMGLGNFGSEYDGTRHNAGVLLLRKLAARCGAEFSREKYCGAHIARAQMCGAGLVLAFSDSYMNLSGESLKKILRFFKAPLAECAVISDDITLEPGRLKLSRGGSSGGHNGLGDIIEKCGNDFIRIRVGVGAKPDKRMDLADYVLGRPSAEDAEKIASADIWGCMELLLTKGFEGAQNEVNRRAAAGADSSASRPE